MNSDTQFTKINVPRYIEQQNKNTRVHVKLRYDAKCRTLFNAAMNKKGSSTEFPIHFELNGMDIVNKQTIADECNLFLSMLVQT